MSLNFIFICFIAFAITGCVAKTHSGITSNIPKWVLVVDESDRPLERVVLGVEAPVPLVNQYTNKKGMVRVGYRSLFPNGYVLLSKKGYDAYYEHYDKTPDKVILKAE